MAKPKNGIYLILRESIETLARRKFSRLMASGRNAHIVALEGRLGPDGAQ